MTDISKLRELLERVESATGPDRELDCDIFCATAESPFVNYYPDCVLASLGGFAARVEIAEIDKFTASIDAAVALCERVIPESNCVGFDKTPEETTAYVSRNYCAGGDGSWLREADGKTPALAFCAAILRAKIAMLEKEAHR